MPGANNVASAPALIFRFPHDDPLARDLLAAEIDGTGASAIHDADDLEWRIFYPTPGSRDAASAALGRFCRAHGIRISRIEVDDEDWARRTQAALTSVRVGEIIVSPPWDVPAPGTPHPAPAHQAPGTRPHQAPGTRHQAPGHAPTVIVIEPSVGFGTGHHASTRLCLLALQQLDLAAKSVIDVGTGSGVLAIAALKLGAAHVTAIDSDADALANARENAAQNGVSVDFHVADVAAMRRPDPGHLRPSAAFDVVLANLTAAWLRRLSAPLLKLAADRSTFVLSGLQTSERDRVLEAFLPSRRLERELEEEGWVALVLQ